MNLCIFLNIIFPLILKSFHSHCVSIPRTKHSTNIYTYLGQRERERDLCLFFISYCLAFHYIVLAAKQVCFTVGSISPKISFTYFFRSLYKHDLFSTTNACPACSLSFLSLWANLRLFFCLFQFLPVSYTNTHLAI